MKIPILLLMSVLQVTTAADLLPTINCPGDIVVPTEPGQPYAYFNYVSLVSSSDTGVAINCATPNATLPDCRWASETFSPSVAPYIFAKGANTVTCVATKTSPGIITTIAGNGTAGFGGDGGPAASASFNYPRGLATDSAGNVFIADLSNNRIRRWEAASGTLSTVAGNGTAGFSGDGGPATSAQLYHPYSVAVDSHGNVYIADQQNSCIRKVEAASGTITTFAGMGGSAGFSGDGGPATSARIYPPVGVALDSNDNLFFSCGYGFSLIRRVDAATGIISTIAGVNGWGGFGGDGGPATSATLNVAADLMLDSAGNLFFCDSRNNRIRRVDGTTGIITTVAGNGIDTYGGDGGPAINASLSFPNGLAMDAAGNLFSADSGNHLIRRVEAATGIISTVAGAISDAGFGFRGDGGPASSALFNGAYGVALNSSGNLFIADQSNHRIRRVDLPVPYSSSCSFKVIVRDTEPPSIICPSDVAVAAAPGQPSAVVQYPLPTATDNGSNVIVTCTPPPGSVFPVGTTTVTATAVDTAGGIVTTIAGNGLRAYGGDGGLATNASFSLAYNPVAVDVAGNVFIADSENNRVRRVDAASGVITTVAGNGGASLSGLGGAATSAGVPFPAAVAVDNSGNLFISIRGRILRVDVAAGTISVFAGNGSLNYNGDGGLAINASIGQVMGLALDGTDSLLLVDVFNGVVRKINAQTGIISTVAGNGIRGFSGDGGAATNASLLDPEGLAVDPAGNIFINDSGNFRIRRVDAQSGIITTVAGKGYGFNECDQTGGIRATNLFIISPHGNLAVDAAGNFFFVHDSQIFRVDAVSGIVTPVVGSYNGGIGFNGDGAPADQVQINTTGGLALDTAGNLYFSDTFNFRIRRASFAGAAMGNTASCTFTVTVQAVPLIASLEPALIFAGGPDFTLTVNGTNFISSPTVLWNGVPRPTTFVSQTQLTAVIPASDIALNNENIGVAIVTVVNANGLPSNPQPFTFVGDNVTVAETQLAIAGAIAAASTVPAAANQAGVSAQLANSSGSQPVTVTAANYSGNPGAGTVFDAGGGFVDIKVTGAGADSVLTADFYYAASITGAAEVNLVLLYLASDNSWQRVFGSGGAAPLKDTMDLSLSGVTFGGRFSVVFDNTSTPRVSELTGTPFAVAVDRTLPVITCPADIVTRTDPGQCAAVVNYSVTATDNSGNANVTCSPPAGSAFPKGTTIVNCTATDPSGNSAICSFSVTVSDPESPSFTLTGAFQTKTIGGNPFINSEFVTTGDFNGDGNVDVVAVSVGYFAERGTNDVAVMLGDGAGNFAPGRVFSVPFSCHSVAVGDFNGDGKMDMAVANGDDSTFPVRGNVSLLFGDGAGGFGQPVNIHLGFCYKVVAGDFNGDGKMDLAVANWDETKAPKQRVTVLLGDAHGGFAVATNLFWCPPPTGNPTISLADSVAMEELTVGDFNADGKLDLAIPNSAGLALGGGSTTCGINVWLGNGAGNFSAAMSSPVTFGNASGMSMAVGDFNEDGRLDVVTVQGYVGDFGQPAIPAGSINVSIGHGDGSFGPELNYIDFNRPTAVAVGDFNNDGHLDLAVAENNSGVSILLGNGQGGFSFLANSPGSAFYSLAVADFNHDGRLDVASEANSGATIYLNGKSTLPNDITVSLPPGTTSVPVTFPTPIASDNCPGVVVSCVPPSGSSFSSGTNTVTCTATDSSGNTVTTSFLVKVVGLQPLFPATPANLASSTAPGLCSAVVNYGINYFGYACTPPSGSSFAKGTITVDCTPPTTGNYATGIISTVVGTGTAGFSGDGALASAAQISVVNFPGGLATDAAGNLYLADEGNLRVRKVDAATGIISTVAGNGQSGFNGDGLPATQTSLRPKAVAFDQSGNLLIADSGNSRIRNVNAVTGLITTVAGNGLSGFGSDGVLATAPGFNGGRLSGPSGLAMDGAGNLFINDQGNYRIRRVDAVTQIMTTVAGNGTFGSAGDGGPATNASFKVPSSIALDSHNNIYITDADRVRKVDTLTGIIILVAGGGTTSTSEILPNVTLATNLNLGSVDPGIALDANDNFFFASGSKILRVDGQTGRVTRMAGTDNGFSGDSGLATSAMLNYGRGLTLDRLGHLYYTDAGNNRIRRINLSGSAVATSFTVTVNDTERPAITCPANLVVSTDPGQCSAVVNYPLPAASDHCPGVTVVSTPPSGSVFQKGTTLVNCTATDASGNSASCSFTVTVVDAEKPTLTSCPTNMLVSTAPGQCSAVVNYLPPVAQDNCPGVTLACNPASGATFSKGTNPVLCTATDASGNTNACSFTITVLDTEKPTISSCPTNMIVSTDPGQCSVIVVFPPAIARDNCPGVTVVSSPPRGSAFPKGINLVTCTATDSSGNSSTCAFTITVNDTERPTITCPPNITVNTDPGQCSARNVALGTPAVADNCSVANVGNNAPAIFPKGTTVVAWSVTDTSGNSATGAQNVTVLDRQPPTITCPADIFANTDPGQCSAVVTYNAAAADNCSGVNVSSSPPSGSAFPIGTNNVTVTASDSSGNTASCIFTITVLDNEPPTFIPLSSSVLSPFDLDHPIQRNNDPGDCYATVTFANPKATDNCDPSTLSVTVTALDETGANIPLSLAAGDQLTGQFPAGRSVVTSVADDGRGNTIQHQTALIVTDVDQPVITCPGDQRVVVNRGEPVVFTEATAVDNCDLQSVVCTPPSGTVLDPGSNYVVKCVATDIHGLSNTCTFTVTVVAANLPPVANAGADETVLETSTTPSVQLSGCSSTDDGKPVVPGSLSFLWKQVAGTPVVLSSATACNPTFRAPLLPSGSSEVLTFSLVANDGELNSPEAFVNITVKNANHPPECHVSAPTAVAEGSPAVTLNGAASFDPDADSIVSYQWTQISGPQTLTLAGANTANASFDAPFITSGGGNTTLTESYSFRLTVGDGQLSTSSDVTVIVDNLDHCPTANPGGDGLVTEGNGYTLNGSASSDPDNDPLLYAWKQNDGPPVTLVNPNTASPSFQAPFVNAGGTNLVFALTVDDEFGCTDTKTVTVHVDNAGDPPTCAGARASVTELWPPNHKMIPVSLVNVGTGDRPTTIRITSIRQDEPSNGLGDGDTPCDAIIAADGASLLLRAERAGTGNGRVYHIYFTATNSEGTCSGEIQVGVPRDQKPGHICVDDGPRYPSCP
ncbi:MAG: HYR domain-containing protein [Verrucomicrobia bacterium]|nr:HYR domain-containing protein [Verrucomicrobiota bacterium]